MCGICGFTGNEDKHLLDGMLETIRHRGPDDRGHFSSDTLQMGMVRLSIIDLETGGQPMTNNSGDLSVICNGEIFNYIELRKDLISKGHVFNTASDVETILHGYEEYGIDFLEHLNGMFAIAIWDAKEERLILVRDRYGVKPLYYSFLNGTLIFGSEIKALKKHPLVGRDLDHEALAHYFCLRNIPAPFTAFKAIRALPPGNMLFWKSGSINIKPWYEIPKKIMWQDSDQDTLVDMVDELLRDSVRLRLRSDVTYGAYLSGGIDSSTVVAMMSQMSDKPVKTFSLAYADNPEHKQDAHYARMIAKQYGTEHQEYVMRWHELQDELPQLVDHFDQPFAGVIASFWLSRYMSKHVTVALSGDGADDMFASYGHHRLVWPLASANRMLKAGQPLDGIDFTFFKGRESFVRGLAGLSPWEWRLAYGAYKENEKKELFSRKGFALFGEHSTANFLRDIYLKSPAETDDLNKMLYLDMATLLPNEILHFNDMLSMANSMEVRTPFLDYRLVNLACSIPGSLKIRDSTLKYILRKVAARYVPEEILQRPKEGFVLPKNTWLREGLSSMITEILSKERMEIHGFFRPQFIDILVEKFCAGDDSLTFKLWTLMFFQLWYEGYLAEA